MVSFLIHGNFSITFYHWSSTALNEMIFCNFQDTRLFKFLDVSRENKSFLCNDKNWIELLVAHKFSLSRAATLHYVRFFSTNSSSKFTISSMKFTLNFIIFNFIDTYTLQFNKFHSEFHCFNRNFIQNLIRLTLNYLQENSSRTYSSHCAESEKNVRICEKSRKIYYENSIIVKFEEEKTKLGREENFTFIFYNFQIENKFICSSFYLI